MVTAAALLTLHASEQTCVWMDAGVLAYRLCDRGFNCEHCPLDAALRGTAREHGAASPDSAPPTAAFPDDRLYTTSHTWVRTLDESGRRVRVGLDGFAAPLIGPPREARPSGEAESVRRGHPLCTLVVDGETLHVLSPVTACRVRWNGVLDVQPKRLVTDPYSTGWLAELEPRPGEALDGLLDGAEARRHARFDARRFRRLAAFELLADADAPVLPGPSEGAPDLRRLLGVRRYIAIVRQLMQ